MFICGIKYLLKISYTDKRSLHKHCDPVSGFFGTGEVVGDDDSAGVVLFLYLINESVDLKTGDGI